MSLDLRNVRSERGEIELDLEMEHVEPERAIGDLARPYSGLSLREVEAVRRQASPPPRRPRAARLDGTTADSGRPIFVLGSGRCGTSILTWALGQHPNIGVLEETNWLPLTLLGAAAAHRMAAYPARNATTLYGVDRARFLHQVAGGLDRLHRDMVEASATRAFIERLSDKGVDFNPDFQIRRSQWSPKARWVDGTPLNTNYLPLIAEAFPNARFVAIIRDPVETIRSYINFRPPGRASIDVAEAANYWLSAMRSIMNMTRSPERQRTLVVDYHEMISNPRDAMRDCFRFLDEPNFGPAADTFNTRINSSYAEDADYRDLETSDGVVGECVAIYERYRSGIEREGDAEAVHDYKHWENDAIRRIIGCIT